MSGILRLESLTKGNTLKQGDKTPLKYRLFDADGETLNVAGKSATVRLVYPDFLTIGYEKGGLTVAQDDTVTFTIDTIIPSRIYHVEIIVDDQFIFPSRADETKFTVDSSSLGTEANIIEVVGVDAVVRKAVDLINKDPNLIIDEDKLVTDIISNTGIGSIEEYHQQFNDVIKELSEDKDYHSLPEIAGARGGHSTLGERLDETTAQLAHKVGGTVKAKPEDLSAETLGLVTGAGGPINLMSIPQDYSVTPEKTTFIQLSENRDRFLDKRINLNTYINPENGIESYHETFATSEFIAVEPLTSYIFWWDDTKNIAGVHSKVYYDENKVFISGGYGGNPMTTPANCVFMRIEINEATSFDNLIMQKGSTKSENIPNPLLTGIDVELNSDNLAIEVDNLAFINDPINKDIFLDKKIYLNTYINPTVGTPSNHATFATSEYIEVEPETTYRFSRLDGTITGFGNVLFYDTNKVFISGQYSGSPFTSPAGCRYVRVSVNEATTFDNVILQKGEAPSYPINKKVVTDFIVDEGYFNKKWVVVGDSITEKNFRAKIHYHDYIRAELGLKVVNMGVSGSGYKEREDSNNAFYQRVSNIPTDVNFITIMGGVNDVLTSQPLGEVTDSTTDTVCGCINKTIDNIYDTHPLAQIGLITPVPGADYNPANTNNDLALLSEKIIEIAKLRGLPSMDLYHSSGLRPWNSVVNKALFSTTESPDGDGLHPNAEGHKFFYRKIMEFIKSL